MLRIKLMLPLVVIMLTACSMNSEQSEAVDGMYAAMGGLDNLLLIENIVLKGSGTRGHLGQISVTGGEDPLGQIDGLTETIDLLNGRAAFDNDIVIGGGFGQHRTEAYTNYMGQKIGWGTTEGRPNIATSVNGLFSWASHNSPQKLLTRNVISVALSAQNAIEGSLSIVDVEGISYQVIETELNGESISVYIDLETKRLAGFQVLDTESMWGDQESYYQLGDYRLVENLLLPFSLQIIQGSGVYASIQYEQMSLNADDLSILEVPDDVIEQANQVIATQRSWVPLEWNQVAEGVTHIVAFSHHSMLIEFAEYIAVVEGPYTEAQSLRLVDMVEEQLGKPVRFVIPTHPHYDHTGGLRGFAAVGATIIASTGHEEELRMILEAPHSNPADALAMRLNDGAEVGQIEVFETMTTIEEGGQRVEIYAVEGIPHVSPKVLVYVPDSKILFQSDLFFGGPSDDATGLYDAIISLGLEVELIVGGHGGVLPFSSLQGAVTTE